MTVPRVSQWVHSLGLDGKLVGVSCAQALGCVGGGGVGRGDGHRRLLQHLVVTCLGVLLGGASKGTGRGTGGGQAGARRGPGAAGVVRELGTWRCVLRTECDTAQSKYAIAVAALTLRYHSYLTPPPHTHTRPSSHTPRVNTQGLLLLPQSPCPLQPRPSPCCCCSLTPPAPCPLLLPSRHSP